jgi:uncharacterized membrane protein YkoI
MAKGNDLSYLVRVVAGETNWTVSIDSTSGKVLSSHEDAPAARAALHGIGLKAFGMLKTTLAEAVNVAEKVGRGWAIDATYKGEPPNLAYIIDLAVKDGTTKTVTIDAKSGHVRKVTDDVDAEALVHTTQRRLALASV